MYGERYAGGGAEATNCRSGRNNVTDGNEEEDGYEYDKDEGEDDENEEERTMDCRRRCVTAVVCEHAR